MKHIIGEALTIIVLSIFMTLLFLSLAGYHQ